MPREVTGGIGEERPFSLVCRHLHHWVVEAPEDAVGVGLHRLSSHRHIPLDVLLRVADALLRLLENFDVLGVIRRC